MSEAVRAAEWLGNNGYWLQELDGGRLGYLVVSDDESKRLLLDSDQDLIAFAREKGWEG